MHRGDAFLPVAFNLAIAAAGILGAVMLAATAGRLLPLTMTAFGVVGLMVLVPARHAVSPRR